MCLYRVNITHSIYSADTHSLFLSSIRHLFTKVDRGTVSVQDLLRVHTTKRRACLSVFNKIFAEL